MISTVIIGAVLELIGAIIMIYNLSYGSMEGYASYWIWAIMGFAVMVAGMIILYAAFRPVVM